MRFFAFACKNLFRRPVRTGLTVLAIALAVAVAVSLIGFNIGYRRSIDTSIDKLGFQVMIMAKGCPYEAATMMLKGGTGLVYLPASTYEEVRSDPDISAITPIFVGVAEKEASGISDEGGSSFAIISGIEVASFRDMKPWMAIAQGAGQAGGRWFADSATGEVVLGYEVAEYEQRKVGDSYFVSITPYGQVEPVMTELKVVGILERTGTQDDGTVFMPILEARRLFNRPNELTIVGFKLKNFSGLALRQFEQRWAKLPEVQVVGLQQVKTTLVSLVETAQTMIASVAVVAIIVAVIGVINSILMSVFERTGEIGIMKAIGATRSDIFQIIWLETMAICIGGGLAGVLLAVSGTSLVEKALQSLIDFGTKGSLVAITPEVMLTALLGSAVIGCFAGLYPAWRASSLRPVEAIREGE
ncbi:MAG TPA: ABC transporter permease [Candidatus Rifleibacterium sp.]|mgnify:FL=1|nr:ABC transporter permease [Candidatus Rifleibacterium sp.]HPT46220.1 ABC transporter permease [Candidatus Rifleibacterium sp.]